MTLFWGFHELSGSVITLFASRKVALEGIMTAAQTNSLNSMFIIILAIPISLLWGYLSKNNLNPRTPFKFGLGLLLAGASFYILSISGASADENGMVPFAYLFIMYFILSIGELFMSPVGLSKITDLSPKRIVAFMMGIWFLASAFAFQIVGFISTQLAIESDDKNLTKTKNYVLPLIDKLIRKCELSGDVEQETRDMLEYDLVVAMQHYETKKHHKKRFKFSTYFAWWVYEKIKQLEPNIDEKFK